MDDRVREMEDDDKSHFLIYQVLRVTDDEGHPNRDQAINIQKTLETLYSGVGGEYHFGDAAWKYLKTRTGVDLHKILKKLAKENTANA